jgi:predicted metal-dependent hydrolase
VSIYSSKNLGLMLNNFLDNLFGGKNAPKKPQKPKNTEGAAKGIQPKLEKTTWLINGQEMPVEIHRERRTSWRYNFGKGRLIVRLPKVSLDYENEILTALKKSLEERVEKKPELGTHYDTTNYKNNDVLTIGNQDYSLHIEDEDRKSHTAKLKPNKVIEIKLAAADTEGGKQKAISTLLSRVISGHQSQEFNRRVLEFNHLYFRKDIKSISFKYNHTNWGSCSSSGNLNFSSRLLFAPVDVQNYVIIHELAHLVELNHSDRFWKLVSDAMPDYKEKEKWLKKNGSLCHF